MARVAERVGFPSTSGPTLAGLIDLPEREVRGWGVFAHGFTLGKDSPAASRICKQLASEGIGVLRFDNLGLGDSEGDWGDGSFSNKVADTVRAVEFMNSTGRQVRLLVGHSFGGAAVIAAAHECPTVGAVVSIGAPYQPAHVEHSYDALCERIEAEGEAPFLIGGKALTLKRHFIEDVRDADLREVSARCAGLCSSCIRPRTTPSASPTRARSSAPPGTRAVSCRSRAPTICSPARTRRHARPESSARGPTRICDHPRFDEAARHTEVVGGEDPRQLK